MENTLSMTTAWNEAEEMRKSGKFETAFPVFMESFKANSDEGSLWRAVHCARKTNQFDVAVQLIEENKQMLSTSQPLKSQFCWLKYEYIIDRNKKSGNWEGIIKASEEILELITDCNDLIFRLALFAAIDAAKKTG